MKKYLAMALGALILVVPVAHGAIPKKAKAKPLTLDSLDLLDQMRNQVQSKLLKLEAEAGSEEHPGATGLPYGFAEKYPALGALHPILRSTLARWSYEEAYRFALDFRADGRPGTLVLTFDGDEIEAKLVAGPPSLLSRKPIARSEAQGELNNALEARLVSALADGKPVPEALLKFVASGKLKPAFRFPRANLKASDAEGVVAFLTRFNDLILAPAMQEDRYAGLSQ